MTCGALSCYTKSTRPPFSQDIHGLKYMYVVYLSCLCGFICFTDVRDGPYGFDKSFDPASSKIEQCNT